MGSSWWVTETLNAGAIFLGSWIFWAIFSVVMHELAHGWAAIRRGDLTPQWTGHMTWNPIVHINGWAWLVFALFGILWGRMPIDPSRIRGRYGLAYVAIAGPAMNLLISFVCLLSLVAWMKLAGGVQPPVKGNVTIFLNTGAWLNMVLMVFNLIPVPPLDGSAILSNFSRRYEALWEGPRGAIFGLIAFLIVFNFADRYVFGIANHLTEVIRDFLT